jgi:hypothetical protein
MEREMQIKRDPQVLIYLLPNEAVNRILAASGHPIQGTRLHFFKSVILGEVSAHYIKLIFLVHFGR